MRFRNVLRFSNIGFVVLISGCNFSPGIKDPNLRDRVRACSAGFSDDLRLALQGSYDKKLSEGGVSADIKEEAQSLIFAELPRTDRLAAYNEYISCIEGKWEKGKISQRRK